MGRMHQPLLVVNMCGVSSYRCGFIYPNVVFTSNGKSNPIVCFDALHLPRVLCMEHAINTYVRALQLCELASLLSIMNRTDVFCSLVHMMVLSFQDQGLVVHAAKTYVRCVRVSVWQYRDRRELKQIAG